MTGRVCPAARTAAHDEGDQPTRLVPFVVPGG